MKTRIFSLLPVGLLAGACTVCLMLLIRGRDLIETLGSEWKKEAHLNAQISETRARIRPRQELVHELMEGRLSMAEAIARLRKHYEGSHAPWVLKDNTEERLGHSLLAWVRHTAARNPHQSPLIVQRLEQELRSHLNQSQIHTTNSQEQPVAAMTR